MQWILPIYNVLGNEIKDTPAKEGQPKSRRTRQPYKQTRLSSRQGIAVSGWSSQRPRYNRSNPYHLLSTTTRLRRKERGRGCSSVGRVSDRHTADTSSIPSVRQGIFLPESAFGEGSLKVSVQSHATARINICAHVTDPVVHVDHGSTQTPSTRGRLGSATLSQLAFPGKATRISHGENPIGTIKLEKVEKLDSNLQSLELESSRVFFFFVVVFLHSATRAFWFVMDRGYSAMEWLGGETTSYSVS